MCIPFFFFGPCSPKIKLVLHGIGKGSFSSTMQYKFTLRWGRKKLDIIRD